LIHILIYNFILDNNTQFIPVYEPERHVRSGEFNEFKQVTKTTSSQHENRQQQVVTGTNKCGKTTTGTNECGKTTTGANECGRGNNRRPATSGNKNKQENNGRAQTMHPSTRTGRGRGA
jgi:hypothetical protein